MPELQTLIDPDVAEMLRAVVKLLDDGETSGDDQARS